MKMTILTLTTLTTFRQECLYMNFKKKKQWQNMK